MAARYAHGTCMVYAWYVYDICMHGTCMVLIHAHAWYVPMEWTYGCQIGSRYVGVDNAVPYQGAACAAVDAMQARLRQ